MDIRTTGGPATADETAAIDGFLGAPESLWEGGVRRPADDHVAYGGRAVRSQRHLLLPVLHAIQDRVGWVSRGALEYACRRLSIPPAEAYGVVSFYARFALQPRGPLTLRVCDDIVCALFGADEVCAAAGAERSPCLGLCDHAPAALVERSGSPFEEVQVAPVTSEQAADILRGETWPTPLSPTLPPGGGGRLLRRVGNYDPQRLDDYVRLGGFEALRRGREMGPEGVVREVTEARLLGRGGAAFPTGRKWESVAKAAARPHYLVCNADESEPGTFKDRVLMEADPFAVVEGMAIAAFATGCEKGYIYIRAEYPLARERIESAVALARGAGLVDIDIEVRRGAGAYICGEETALFNSIEGKRGEPRNKPPFPVEVGLFGKPTLPNNVETLLNVLDIVLDGGAAFASSGTKDSTGSRLFCVSGHVERPGLYEVVMGTPLRELLQQAGAGTIQAVLLGGAAGSFLTPDQVDVPLSFEGTRAIGATLGSGAVVVFDESADMKHVLLRIARFFRDESCGQCVPCRVGTKRQEEILERMLGERIGDARADAMLLSDIAQAMRDASICGLGQTAANAIASGLTQLKVLNG
ncbi:MAG: NADH-quinone oxidoreductase subunit E [Chloroflexi bacterium]|nr:MAG: NADH-quinone oxidoreductase subunit E [Chloroflexota bacterium]